MVFWGTNPVSYVKLCIAGLVILMFECSQALQQPMSMAWAMEYYSRIPAIRNLVTRNLALELRWFPAEIAFFLTADCDARVKSRN